MPLTSYKYAKWTAFLLQWRCSSLRFTSSCSRAQATQPFSSRRSHNNSRLFLQWWHFHLHPFCTSGPKISTICLGRSRERIVVYQSRAELDVRAFGHAHATADLHAHIELSVECLLSYEYESSGSLQGEPIMSLTYGYDLKAGDRFLEAPVQTSEIVSRHVLPGAALVNYLPFCTPFSSIPFMLVLPHR